MVCFQNLVLSRWFSLPLSLSCLICKMGIIVRLIFLLDFEKPSELVCRNCLEQRSTHGNHKMNVNHCYYPENYWLGRDVSVRHNHSRLTSWHAKILSSFVRCSVLQRLQTYKQVNTLQCNNWQEKKTLKERIYIIENSTADDFCF